MTISYPNGYNTNIANGQCFIPFCIIKHYPILSDGKLR